MESDRRVRAVELTPDGEIELAELNQRGDDFAQTVLDPLTESERSRLVESMAEVERLLSLSFARITVEDPAGRDAEWCVSQYFSELAERFDEGFDAAQSIPADAAELRPPHGVFLIARLDGAPVGCGALKVIGEGVGSVKRMWVSTSVRGIGIGRRLLLALEEEGRKLGLETLRLETNKNLSEAHGLYRRNGYVEVDPFNEEAYAHHWFEKRVDGSC